MMEDFNLEKAEQLGFKLPQKAWEEYNEDEMKRGIEVEKEHIDDEDICAIIAANHLDEIPDYYTRLDEMEEAAKSEEVAEDILRIANDI